MLPILPALLLLILQGPSTIEVMASEGRLPAALQAVSRRLESQDQRIGNLEEVDAAVLASFLAIGNDSDISRVLFHLLALETFTEPKPEVGTPELADEESPPPIFCAETPRFPDAFVACRRSRDGPL